MTMTLPSEPQRRLQNLLIHVMSMGDILQNLAQEVAIRLNKLTDNGGNGMAANDHYFSVETFDVPNNCANEVQIEGHLDLLVGYR